MQSEPKMFGYTLIFTRVSVCTSGDCSIQEIHTLVTIFEACILIPCDLSSVYACIMAISMGG